MNDARAHRLYVTFIFVALCLMVWGITVQRYGWNPTPPQLYDFGALADGDVAAGDLRRIVLANLMHVDVVHLASNMAVIALVGIGLERLWGSRRMFLLVAVGAIGASIGIELLTPINTVTVGASGVAFAFAAAAATVPNKSFAGTRLLAGQLIAINIVVTFTVPNISIGGHLGGAVAGLIVGASLRRFSPIAESKPDAPTPEKGSTQSAAAEAPREEPPNLAVFSEDDLLRITPKRLRPLLFCIGAALIIAASVLGTFGDTGITLFNIVAVLILVFNIPALIPNVRELIFSPAGVIEQRAGANTFVSFTGLEAVTLFTSTTGTYLAYRKSGDESWTDTVALDMWNTELETIARWFHRHASHLLPQPTQGDLPDKDGQ